MTQSEVLEAVRAWQRSMPEHPLTCAYDADHRPLEPVPVGDHVWLACPDCDYVQARIPELLLRALTLARQESDRGALTAAGVRTLPVSRKP